MGADRKRTGSETLMTKDRPTVPVEEPYCFGRPRKNRPVQFDRWTPSISIYANVGEGLPL
jgi:hypothetical protein